MYSIPPGSSDRMLILHCFCMRHGGLTSQLPLFPLPSGQSLDFGVHLSLMWCRSESWLVRTNHDDPVLFASIWFTMGQNSNPDQRNMRAKCAGGFRERCPYSSKGTLWGNSLSFVCCFLSLCLDVAVFRCDAWNCVSHPVTQGIAVLRTYLTEGFRVERWQESGTSVTLLGHWINQATLS